MIYLECVFRLIIDRNDVIGPGGVWVIMTSNLEACEFQIVDSYPFHIVCRHWIPLAFHMVISSGGVTLGWFSAKTGVGTSSLSNYVSSSCPLDPQKDSDDF